MAVYRIHLLSFLLGLIVLSCTRSHVEKVFLDQGWSYKQPDSADWRNARVPGSVHLNLFNQGIIEDPFFGNNEKQLQWVGEGDWEFKTSFFGRELLVMDKVELVFEGLDTYADVYLNDSLLLRADNMFRIWHVDVKNHLKGSENHLYIRFYAPGRIEKDKEAEVNYRLPEIRGFTRKAPYQYGWDWGPTFITSGIWQPIYLRAWNDVRIEQVQTVLNQLKSKVAEYSAMIEIQAVEDIEADILLTINDEPIEEIKKHVVLSEGFNQVKLDFSIPDPQLWWPNGLGKQVLYDLDFRIVTKNSFDIKNTRIGIREVDLVIEEDSIGESFYFMVNGEPVFMKGANYIPQDNFLARVPDDKYRQTLQTAVDANMNMLRVWGGGVYERDIFYELCDELGLLVWQDFMFACNMYPGDDAFLDNVKQEARQQVERLRNHPCIAIWCGNNEVSEGWYNWGWQKSLGYTEADSLEVWNAYLSIFEDILPGVVDEYDDGRSYWPSSPSTGWGHEQALYSGDMHYWGVWWGEEPFEIYEQKVGRFMTEYGFQGFPDLNTLDSCLSKNDFDLASEKLRNHQKHPRGMELIRMYMERDYPVPDNFEEYAYVSQLVQAYGIGTALEAHRRATPYCMGTLYWQLNDCWPVISWSSVDYYNRWKALHYFTRTIFDQLVVSFEEKNENLKVYIISDLLKNKNSSLVLELIDFQGNVLWQDEHDVTILKNSSSVYHTLEMNSLLAGKDKKQVLLKADVEQDGKSLANGVYYFVNPKELVLNDSEMDVSVEPNQEGYDILLHSETLVKNVCLVTDVNGHFSDNYFDLMPGASLRVKFSAFDKLHDFDASGKEFSEQFKILTLNDL